MQDQLRSLCLSKMIRFFLATFFVLLFGDLMGATINVGPPPASIQTAIDNANDGDTIQLSAGTYVEEIHVISKNLTILGVGTNSTTIQAPAIHLTQNFSFGGVRWWCIVMVDNQAAPTSQTVDISQLTVDGDSQQDTLPPYGNSDRFFAIGYHNANGTIQNVHTTNTRQTANFNELAGGGIVNASDSGTITFNVNQCLVDFYQRLGIDCRGAALTAHISNSTINRGYVLTPGSSTATPNGIQFSGSATGTITNNSVSGNIATISGAAATGILPFGAGSNLTVSGNVLDNNDNGIISISSGDNLIISNNTLSFTGTPGNNPPEGIAVQDTNGLTTITSNVMNNIPFINMELISSTNQPFMLMNNQFIGSQTGLIVTGNTTTGPVVMMNGDSFTGTIGDYIVEVAAPNDIWPSTATVSFDGLISGHMTVAEFNQVMAKIIDKHDDPALGLVLEFIPHVPPAITNISPTSGSAAGGTTVTITGTDFISDNTRVFFGTTAALSFTVVSDTTITAIAPPGTGTVDVRVETSFGISPIVPEDQYTYIAVPPPPPIVKRIAPRSGPQSGGTSVKISGSNFIEGDTQVFFGTTPALSVVFTSNKALIAIAPPGTGVVDVTVETSFGTSPLVPADQYTYIPPPHAPPTVTSIDPPTGSEIGGERITITGTHFIKGRTRVFFGNTRSVNIVVVSDTMIVAVAPPGTGIVDVTVRTRFGTSPIVPADQFTYVPVPPSLPIVTGLDPSEGPESGGTLVTITGANFVAGNTQVFFGLSPASDVVVVSDTIITAIAPPGTGIVDVTVVTPAGTSLPSSASVYTYLRVPIIPLPPSHFTGVIFSKCCGKEFVLKAKWDPSLSPDVVSYRIYKGDKIVAVISADAPLRFKARSDNQSEFRKYKIAAVNADNLESERIRIKIIHH